MNESLMICTQEACTQAGTCFFYYPSQRLSHKQHKAFLIHPATFMGLFNDNELFTNHEIEKISSKLEQEYSQMTQQIEKALRNALKSHCQSNLKLLHTFKDQNEAGFTRMLQMTANGEGNQSYLQIALLALNHKDKTLHIKNYIKEIIRKKMEELKTAVAKIISMISCQQEEKGSQETQAKPSAEQQEAEMLFKSFQPNRMEVQEKPHYKDPEPLPEKEQRQVEYTIWPQNQSNHQSYPPKKSCEPIEINDSSLEFNTQEQTSPQEPVRKTNNQILPKQPIIKKHKKRGRPFKQRTPKYGDTAVYDSVFLQSDMDVFFPKGSQPEIFAYISACAKSPCFKKTIYPNIVMGVPDDYKLVKQDPRLVQHAIELTISQKITYDNQQRLNLAATFDLFQKPNHLIYFHMKEGFLDSQSWESMRILLERNVLSIKTLMIEQCERLPQQFAELIGSMPNLRYLKLHSSYNRTFSLCLEHIVRLEGLHGLSLCSAQFVDRNWGNILEDDEVIKRIRRIGNLKHLCLYNCYPVYDYLLSNLNPNLKQTLTHLNLGITDITYHSVPTIRSFKNLIHLSLDETQLDGKDIIKIFDHSNKNKLKELGVWRLNKSGWKIGKRGFYNGSITRDEMYRLAELLPNLQYINIAHCKGLSGFKLFKFQSLKYACVSVGMYHDKDLNKLKKKLTLYVDPQQYVEDPCLDTMNISTY